MSRVGGLSAKSISQLLSNYIGETVTIFTKSGGQSGAGFTGVILSVNDCFVRLITRIGPPPDVPWVMPVRDLTLEISTEKALRLRVVDAV